MRLYRALCEWLEATARAMNEEHDPMPEGNNFAQAEHAHSYTTSPELHAGYSERSIDDDDGGVYRRRPIGFTRNAKS